MQNARAKQVAALLKACAKSRDLETGIKIHQQALRSGVASNTLVANTLVSMYSKCGSIAQARAAFDAIAAKDIVSWNSIILGYVLNGDSQLALHLFSSMQHPPWNILPDSRTYVAALSACSAMAAAAAASSSSSLKSSLLETGTRIHLQARSSGDVADIFIASKLIDMYAKCGSMIEARRVADRLPGFNLVSWTALLLGYAENDQPELALELFSKMDGISAPRPDGPAFVAAFVACSGLARREAGSKIRSLERAMVLHSRAAKQGFCSSLYVAAGAIGMYRSCGSLIDARYVLSKGTPPHPSPEPRASAYSPHIHGIF